MLRPLRQLLRSPSFTLPSVLGLALANGASAAVFSVFAARLLNMFIQYLQPAQHRRDLAVKTSDDPNALVKAMRGAEIGIRMAVGATPSRIVSMVTGEGVRLAAMGAVIGLGGAAFASDLIVALLFNVNGLDPLVYLLSATLLVAAGAAASSIPAARASATDPARTLHGD